MDVRDFLYMDVDRLKSVLAQLDQGLLESVSKEAGRSKQLSAAAEGKIASIVGVSGGGEFLWTNEETETRTLHDSIYNLVEEALVKAGVLFSIPGDISLDDVRAGRLQERLGDTDFVLLDGHAVVNDFTAMAQYLSRFNEVARFVARSASGDQATPQVQRAKQRQSAEAAPQLPKELVNGLSLMLEVFYKDRIIIKLRPLLDDPMASLVGILRPEFLREPIDVLTYKYGPAPTQQWRMLAQVAAIPEEGETPLATPRTGGEIEAAMMVVFESMKELQTKVQQVTYPEIAVTPIAVYRQDRSE